MLEKPKFVPMARPYAFHIPIYIYLYRRFRFANFAAQPAPDRTNERTGPICPGTWCRRISRIGPLSEHVRKLLGPKVIHLEGLLGASCRALAWTSQRYEE